MKTGLTKKQKVAEIFYNAKYPTAEIYTHDTKLKNGCWPTRPSTRNCAVRQMMTDRVICGLISTSTESASD